MSKTILLVEDDPSDEKLALRAFRQCAIANEIEVVRDGAAALAYLFATGPYASRDPTDLPTVVLLDLKLPLVDGHEVLRAIRGDARTRLLPVVILTTSDRDEDVAKSYGLGANGFVRKPMRFPDLVEATRALGLYWLVVNTPPPPPER